MKRNELKKYLSIVLVAMTCAAFTACGQSSNTSSVSTEVTDTVETSDSAITTESVETADSSSDLAATDENTDEVPDGKPGEKPDGEAPDGKPGEKPDGESPDGNPPGGGFGGWK